MITFYEYYFSTHIYFAIPYIKYQIFIFEFNHNQTLKKSRTTNDFSLTGQWCYKNTY